MPMKRQFPSAPAQLPGEMPDLLRRLADLWAQDTARPRPSPSVLEHWDSLIARWSDDPSLPLLVRKPANNRGAVLVNGAGRKIIPTDNSPAQWAFALAVLGDTPSLDWVREQLAADTIPMAMILKASERANAHHRCTPNHCANPNAAGWKVAHIINVGLASSTALEQMPEAQLREHFVRLMSPDNMFVVPSRYAGLGELPEFCEELQKVLRR
jgi:hypothetical protein